MGKGRRQVTDVTATVNGAPHAATVTDPEAGIVRVEGERPPKHSTGTLNYTIAEDASDIPPALSDGEWGMWRHQRVNPVTMQREVSTHPPIADNLVKTIAIANDQLHAQDPRKLTRDTVGVLRRAAALADLKTPEITDENKDDPDTICSLEDYSDLFMELHALADVVESIMPPEEFS
jgi:hypothetical protein